MADAHIGRILADLVEMLEDSRAGYSAAADQLAQEGDHEIANELRKYSSQRARLSTELRDLALARGFMVRHGGSVGAILYRRWLSLRETLSTDKVASVLSAAERGEEHIVRKYESAVAEGLPDEIRAVLSRQAAEVSAGRDRLRNLRART